MISIKLTTSIACCCCMNLCVFLYNLFIHRMNTYYIPLVDIGIPTINYFL